MSDRLIIHRQHRIRTAIVTLGLVAALGVGTSLPLHGAAATSIATLPLSNPRCSTTAILHTDPSDVAIICLNSCTGGCDTYNTYVPGVGTGSTCKCAAASGGSVCCHLIAGYDENDGTPFAL